MNELQVTVKQTPGTITWNFEELKHELAEQMKLYKTVVYTDKNIGEAKSDVAALRKLRKAVDSRKVEIKKKCLEPYAVIEEQARELMELIDEPIGLIDKKVKDYEARRRAEKKKIILECMEDAFSDLPEDIRNRLISKTYESRWENVTVSAKSYLDAIQAAHDSTIDALRILEDVDEDYRKVVMSVYKVDLNITAAMMKAQEMQKQKELVIERERMRRERELERQKLEAAVLKDSQEAKDINPEPVKADQDIPKPTQPPLRTAQAQPAEHEDGIMEKVLRIRGNENQIAHILGYIKYAGATYEEIR